MSNDRPAMESKWSLLWNTLIEKATKPFQHPELILYWVFIVIIMGANGIFIAIGSEWGKCTWNHSNIIMSICSYFVAILASSSVDLILSRPSPSFKAADLQDLAQVQKHNRLRKMLTMVGISAIILGLGLTILAIFFNNLFSYFVSFIGLLLALIIWLIANAENPNFIEDDDSKDNDPIGQIGGTVVPVISSDSSSSDPINNQKDSNNLEGFKH